jgi:hypothetical protein
MRASELVTYQIELPGLTEGFFLGVVDNAAVGIERQHQRGHIATIQGYAIETYDILVLELQPFIRFFNETLDKYGDQFKFFFP